MNPMTVIIIGIIIFCLFALVSKKKKVKTSFEDLPVQINATESKAILTVGTLKDTPISVSNSILNNNHTDDSIIDITNNAYQIISNSNLKSYAGGVPYWTHNYVYSYSEINTANTEQKSFYSTFKNSFLIGEYLDLEGNTNYAFILLFDLLNEYEIHKQIPKLEMQLQKLGQLYPKTKSYAMSFLIKKMEAKGDNEGVLRLSIAYTNNLHNDYSHYDYWKLGSKYQTKLSLNSEEVTLLNKLWNYNNNFFNIEFCALEILKLYLNTMKGMKEKYNQEGTTLDLQFLEVAKVVAKKHFKYKEGTNNFKYSISTIINDFYLNIFKHCENAVRELYGQKRRINTDIYYTSDAKSEFESKIISKISEILPNLTLIITAPNVATELELNAQNTNRWKVKFEELTSQNITNVNEFINSVVTLGNLNKKNPSLENIFFEASKFISKIDKESALKLYVHYLYHDLKSANFDNKQLTKTIQKNLFKTNEQIHDFEIIIGELIKDKNLEKALLGVSQIYAIKRKKIQLNIASINEVQKQDSGTVELLNEYLKDEYEDESSFIKTQEINNEEVTIQITQKTIAGEKSIYSEIVSFTHIQKIALDIFIKNNFSALQSDLEVFAKSRGVFKNQLIENINETCYEVLDDILIEEDEEYYTINPNYYQILLAK